MIRFDKNIGIFEFVEQLNEQLAPSFKIVDCTPADAADYMLFSVAKVTLEDVRPKLGNSSYRKELRKL